MILPRAPLFPAHPPPAFPHPSPPFSHVHRSGPRHRVAGCRPQFQRNARAPRRTAAPAPPSDPRMGVAVAERLSRAIPFRGRLPAPLRGLAPQGLLLAREARTRALARIRPPNARFREQNRIRRKPTRRPAVVQRRARRNRARTPATGGGKRPPRQPTRPPRSIRRWRCSYCVPCSGRTTTANIPATGG